MDRLLDTPAGGVQRVTSQPDHVKRVHDRGRIREFLAGGGLEAGEPVHRDDLDLVTPRLRLGGEPGLERLFEAAFDHVQQPGRAGAVADRGEVDDHGDVLVAAAGVPPGVFIDAYDVYPVEPAGIVDQDPVTFGQHRVVGGVPRHPETLGDPSHGQVLDHDSLQRPPQPTP